MSDQCSLCLKNRQPPCPTCKTVKDLPIIHKITIHKRWRKEVIHLCDDCERHIYKAIQECKTRSYVG